MLQAFNLRGLESPDKVGASLQVRREHRHSDAERRREIWTCLKNPIQCSKIDWDGLSPRVAWWDCNPPLKNKNLSQPFEAALPFQVELVDPQSYEVDATLNVMQLAELIQDLISGR